MLFFCVCLLCLQLYSPCCSSVFVFAVLFTMLFFCVCLRLYSLCCSSLCVCQYKFAHFDTKFACIFFFKYNNFLFNQVHTFLFVCVYLKFLCARSSQSVPNKFPKVGHRKWASRYNSIWSPTLSFDVCISPASFAWKRNWIYPTTNPTML